MKKTFLNFWQALLLLIGMFGVIITLEVIVVLLFKDFHKTSPGKISFHYLEMIGFVPFIFWIAKKTSLNFKESLFIPDLSTVIRMFAIVVLFKIVAFPLFNCVMYYELLMNSKLLIISTAIRPWTINDLLPGLIGPIVEELLFRGLILKNFLKRYTPINAILLSSILFGVFHFHRFISIESLGFSSIIFFIVGGIIFGILYYSTNSLIIVILAHIIFNALTHLYPIDIELNFTNTIIHSSVYVTALGLLIYQLKKTLEEPNITQN